MGRHAKGFWDKRSNRYYARLGPPGANGKSTAIMLRHENGDAIAYGDTRAVAAAIRRIQADRDAGARFATGPTVAEVGRAFVAWHAENGSAQRTINDHHYHLRRFARFVHGGVRYADRPAAEIGPEDVWRLKQAGLGSVRLLYASIKACWHWAARPVEGRRPVRMIPGDPLQGLAKPRAGAPVGKEISWEATRALIRFAWGWARQRAKTRRDRTRAQRRLKVLCLHLIADAGCRPHEAAELEWDEILWGEGFLHIAGRSKTWRTGKARNVPVSRGLMKALAIVRRWEGSHPRYVFLPAWSRSRRPRSRDWMTWLREELKPAALAAGVPIPEDFTMYFMRHAYQNTGLEVDTAEGVSAAAGNSPKVLMERYENTKRRRIRQVADKISKRRRAKD